MNRLQMLEIVDDKVKKCTLCSELATTRKNTVFGEGNPQSQIVFLGEGPGATEDETGRPFVGRAGQLLENFIRAIGWKRDDVFILNCLKCRPPNNRTPKPNELKNCRQFLDIQLKILQPRYIFCLGGVAANNLLGLEAPISSLRNKWFEYNKAKVLCTFHPSFLLRSPERKIDFWQDLQTLLEAIENDRKNHN